MAEKGKSNVKASAVIYYALLTAALIGLIIFVYLRIMGGSLFLFGYVFGPYALMFAIVTAVLVLGRQDNLSQQPRGSSSGTLAGVPCIHRRGGRPLLKDRRYARSQRRQERSPHRTLGAQ